MQTFITKVPPIGANAIEIYDDSIMFMLCIVRMENALREVIKGVACPFHLTISLFGLDNYTTAHVQARFGIFFAVALAGWMNRPQTEVIECLKEENRVLRERLGPKRLILAIPQKRRLATAAVRLNWR
jgi:hypothetical protein